MGLALDISMLRGDKITAPLAMPLTLWLDLIFKLYIIRSTIQVSYRYQLGGIIN